MSRPRVHRLSGGPRAGSSRPLPRTDPWWTLAPVDGPNPRRRTAWAGSPDAAAEEARAARCLDYLSRLASSTRGATDDAVFDALAAALRSLGLQGHIAVVDADGGGLVVKALVLPAAGTAEVERVLGHAVVGARIPLADPTPYRDVMRERRSVRVDAPLWWARLFAPALGPAEAAAIARLIGLGAVVLAPIMAGQEARGVLTVWSPSLDAADLSTVEILADMAGAALAPGGTSAVPVVAAAGGSNGSTPHAAPTR